MCNFRVGQKVVCVNDFWDFGVSPLEEGREYTVASLSISLGFGIDGHLSHHGTLELVEVVNPFDLSMPVDIGRGFDRRRFRPVVERNTDISIFKAMLNTTPETVGA